MTPLVALSQLSVLLVNRLSVGRTGFQFCRGFRLFALTLFGGFAAFSYSANAQSVDFGTVNVGVASSPIGVTLAFHTAATVASAAVLTQGAPGLDFTDAGGGSCATNGLGHSYSSGDSCTVAITFTPAYAGMRYGAAVLYDSSGNAVATGYVYGMGLGAQVSFTPGKESVIGSGFDSPGNMAVDGAGNIFLVADGGTQFIKETYSGGSYTQTSLFHHGEYGGIAIDGAGNLFIAGHTAIYKEMPSNGGYVESTIGSGMNLPNGIALDADGNIFVADVYNGRVLKETLSAEGTYSQSDILDCGSIGTQSCPSSVTVNPAGKLFITSYSRGDAITMTPDGSGGYVEGSVLTNLVWPSAITIDGQGNLYIASTLANLVVKETLQTDGRYVASAVSSSSIYWPWGVAVDGAGNVYISDTYNARLLKEDISTPPTLSFDATPVGYTSVDSPQGLTLVNSGNAALMFPVPTAGTNPSISTNFTMYPVPNTGCPEVNSSDAAAGMLAVGRSCNLAVNFTPLTTGDFTGTLAVTDSGPDGVAPATQAIQLLGTGTNKLKPTITATASAPTVPTGQSITVTATVAGPAGKATPTGKVTFGGLPKPWPVVTLNKNGVATYKTSSLPAGAYTAYANYSGDLVYEPWENGPARFIVTSAATHVVTLSSDNTYLEYGEGYRPTFCVQVLDAEFNALSGVAVTFGGPGIQFASTSVVTDGGGQACTTMWALQAGNLVASASVSRAPSPATCNLIVSQAILTVKVVPWRAARPYGSVNPVFSATANGLVGSDMLTVTPSLAATTASPVGSYAVTATVSGAAAANYSVSMTPATLVVRNVVLGVNASSVTSAYGQAPPPITAYNIHGFVNGDTAAVISGTAVLSSTVSSMSPIGYYPIHLDLSGLSAQNYRFQSVAPLGVVHVEDAQLTVTADNQTMHVGGPIPAFTWSFSGFVNGDSAEGSVTGTPILRTTATTHTKPGVYPILISIGTLKSPNYHMTTVAETLTILP